MDPGNNMINNRYESKNLAEYKIVMIILPKSVRKTENNARIDTTILMICGRYNLILLLSAAFGIRTLINDDGIKSNKLRRGNETT